MSQSLADQLATTALSGGNAAFIEDLYEQFLKDPSGVDPAWAAYFKRLQGGAGGEVAHTPIRERLLARLKAAARAQRQPRAPSPTGRAPSRARCRASSRSTRIAVT